MSDVTTGERKYLLSFPLKYQPIKGGGVWSTYLEVEQLGLSISHYPRTKLRDECWVVKLEFLDITIEGKAPTEKTARQRARSKLKKIASKSKSLLDWGHL